MSPIDPGRLRHYLRIMQPTRTPDGRGGYTETLAPGEGVWAEVRRLSGDLGVRAMQRHADATHEIRTWAGVDLTTDRRLQDEDGRTFRLLAPPEDEGERGELLVTLAKEEVP